MDEREDIVLVTGAGGALGRAVAREGLKAGYRVRGVERPGQDVSLVPRGVSLRVHHHTSDFLSENLRGVRYVVHTAERLDLSADYDALLDINVGLVDRLLTLSEAAGVERLVHMSTTAVYDSSPGYIEETGRLYPLSAYEQTRIDAEKAVQAREGGWTVLRLGLPYGPMETGISATLAAVPPILAEFISHVPGLRGGPLMHGVHMEDAARAALFVMEQEAAEGEIFNVADHTPMSLGEILLLLAKAYGLPVGPLFPWPGRRLAESVLPILEQPLVLRGINFWAGRVWESIQREHGLLPRIAPHLEAGALPYLLENICVDVEKLRGLGFRWSYPEAPRGYVAALDHYRDQRWVPDLRHAHPPEAAEEALEKRSLRYAEVLDGSSMRLELEVEWPLRRWTRRREGWLGGVLHGVAGAQETEVRGTLQRRRGRLIYELGFEGGDGEPYRLWGEQERWGPVRYRVTNARGEEVRAGELSRERHWRSIRIG